MMKKVISLIALTILLISCKKEVTTPTSGIFRGRFEMTGFNGGGFETGACTIALNDKTRSFSLSVDDAENVPYPSSGTYVISNALEMIFASKQTPAPNTNPHILLDSVYSYKFDDTSFEITKIIDTIKYDYKFLRY